MRFHIHDEARYAAGPVATGRSLTIYEDEAMATKATLYAAATGGTTIDNPMTVPSTGIIDCWVEDSLPFGLAQGDSLARPLRVMDKSSAVSVTDYGAKGNGTTDDTDAVAAAFAAALGFARTGWNRPALYFPSGSYVLDTDVIAVPTDNANRHWTIHGDGMYATEILAGTGTGAMMSFGDWTATPADWFVGSRCQGICIRDLTIRNADNTPVANTSLRTGVGIRDNGCGYIQLDNVNILGFATGLYAPYGGDFDYLRRCLLRWNDLGAYFGPASQQVKLDSCTVALNYEGVVTENAPEVRYDSCHFIDNSLGDIIIENNNALRSGATNGTRYPDGMHTVDKCWFETGSDALQYPSASDQVGHIRITGDRSTLKYWRGLTVRDSILVSGTTGMATKGASLYGFISVEGEMVLTRALVENLTYYGAHKDYIVAVPAGSVGQACRVSVRNVFTRDGYTKPKIFSQSGYEGRLQYSANWNGYHLVPSLTIVPTTSTTDESTVGITITTGTAAPSTEPRLQGDIVYNTAPAASGLIGWVCTVAGTPGTWAGFGYVGLTATAPELNLTDDSVATITLAPAAGGANVCEVTITVKDAAGVAIDNVHTLELYLSDSAAGAGLTTTTASGTVTAKAASGAVLTDLTAKKHLKVTTLASGVFILEITDTAKTGFYVCAVNPLNGKVFASAVLTGSYGA